MALKRPRSFSSRVSKRARMGGVSSSFRRKYAKRSRKVYAPGAIFRRRALTANNILTIPIGSQVASGAYTPTLAVVPDYAVLAGLFDMYRIRKIVWMVRSVTTPEAYVIPNTGTASTNAFYPDIYATVDHNDNTAPAAVADLLQYDKLKRGVLYPNRWFKYTCYPNTLNNINGGGFGALSNKQWLNTAQTTTPYYGIKWVIDGSMASGTNLGQAYRFENQILVYVEFKNTQ